MRGLRITDTSIAIVSLTALGVAVLYLRGMDSILPIVTAIAGLASGRLSVGGKNV